MKCINLDEVSFIHWDYKLGKKKIDKTDNQHNGNLKARQGKKMKNVTLGSILEEPPGKMVWKMDQQKKLGCITNSGLTQADITSQFHHNEYHSTQLHKCSLYLQKLFNKRENNLLFERKG